jgi:hypothetical protein
LFTVARDAPCATRKGERATEEAARACLAGGATFWSVLVKQRRGRCCCCEATCTRRTMDWEERKENGRGSP